MDYIKIEWSHKIGTLENIQAKMCNILLILLFLFFPIDFAISASGKFIITAVPFLNIILPPGGNIQASYCFENNLQSVGLVQWPYKGTINSAALSLSLVTSGVYQGQFADPSGTISVTNNTTASLVVNCQFAF